MEGQVGESHPRQGWRGDRRERPGLDWPDLPVGKGVEEPAPHRPPLLSL